MKRFARVSSALVLAAFASAPVHAATIDAGTHTLLPNTPGQVIEIMLTPGDPTENLFGVDFGVVLGDGSLDPPSNAKGPVFTGLDIIGPGTIFEPANVGVFSVEIQPRVRTASTVTPDIGTTVPGSGVLARVTVDTTGVSGVVGQDLLFPLILDDDFAGTHLSDEFGEDPLTVTNGQIRIAAVPEPSAAVLAVMAVLAGGMIARKHNKSVPRSA